MNRFTLSMVAVVGLAVGVGAGDDASRKELKKFEGTWQMVAGERDGAKLKDAEVTASKITWKGGDATVTTPHQSGEPIKATVTVTNASKKPAEMEWVRSNGPDAGKKMLAIYEFVDADNYRICFAPAGKDRPTEFSTKAGSGQHLHVWKRVNK